MTETPPHAWGRQDGWRYDDYSNRNTPTCVGKTETCCDHPLLCKKHPHMRGEDSVRLTCSCHQAETPPHAWGRLHQPDWWRCGLGKTPTCVGTTMRSWQAGVLRW